MKKKLLKPVTAAAIALAVLGSPFIPLSTNYVLAAVAKGQADPGTPPIYETRDEIPAQYKWKLEDIYPDRAAWDADASKLHALTEAFVAAYKGKLGESAESMKKAIDAYSELNRIFDNLYVYAMMSLDANAGNPELQELADKADGLLATLSEQTSWISPEIIAIPDEKLNAILADKSIQPFKMYLSTLIRGKPHTRSEEVEQVLAQTYPLYSAPDTIYNMLMKDLKFPVIQDENGEDVQLTRANFVSFLESKDSGVRKRTYDAYYQAIGGYKDTIAATLSAHVKGHNIDAKIRGYDSAVEAALDPNYIPVSVYDNLVASVHDNLDLMHRYMDLKKRMLNVDELHMQDMYVSIVESDERYIPYEEAKDRVLSGLAPLGKEYTDVLKEGLEGGWVDVYSTPDKRSGAYQWGTYDSHPYLLLNYQGTYDEVNTLAHEMGHALHSYYSNKSQNYLHSAYPTFTAEVASTINEVLLFKSQYAQADTIQQKMYLLNQFLENFRSTLFRQTQFAEFERIIHEMDQNGEALTAEAMSAVYADINSRYYGDQVVTDENIALEWARIPHFYRNFYVYQYATSYAAAIAFANQVLAEGEPAVERIKKEFLSAGNSKEPIEVLKAAGVDMSTSKPIEQAMEIFEEALAELEKLVAEQEAAAAQEGLGIEYDGERVKLAAPAINAGGTVYAEVRSLFEAVGAEVIADEAAGTVTLKYGDRTITLVTEEENGVMVSKGKWLVPVRHVSEALGLKVEWNGEKETVILGQSE